MAAPQRVTVVTPQGQVVTGVTTQTPRPGATVTVLVGSGSNTRQVVGRVVGPSQQQGQGRGGGGRSSIVGTIPPALTHTTVLPESGEVRFLDGLITIAVAAVTVLWTATRKGTSALGWAVFWTLLGIVMAVEGRGELRYGGFGVASANASYLALRLAGIAQVESMRAALLEAAAIATDGRGEAAWRRRQQMAAVQPGYWGMRTM